MMLSGIWPEIALRSSAGNGDKSWENRAYGKQSIAGQAWDDYGRIRSTGECGGLSEFLPESVICDTGTGGF